MIGLNTLNGHPLNKKNKVTFKAFTSYPTILDYFYILKKVSIQKNQIILLPRKKYRKRHNSKLHKNIKSLSYYVSYRDIKLYTNPIIECLSISASQKKEVKMLLEKKQDLGISILNDLIKDQHKINKTNKI